MGKFCNEDFSPIQFHMEHNKWRQLGYTINTGLCSLRSSCHSIQRLYYQNSTAGKGAKTNFTNSSNGLLVFTEE